MRCAVPVRTGPGGSAAHRGPGADAARTGPARNRRGDREPPTRAFDLRADGALVRCVEVGERTAPALLFLHGWGLTPRTYLPAVSRLCAAGVRVVAPTLPGFGASTPLRPLAGLSEFADRVAAVAAVLQLGPCFVAGHSFGGGVALALASEHPELVRGLILVNAVGGAPGPAAATTPASWLRWLLRAGAELDPRDFVAIAPGLARDFVPNLLRHPAALVGSALVALAADLSEPAAELVASDLPVLFVWADRDRLIGPGGLEASPGRLGPEVVHGRHGWMLRHPEQFAELLRNALVVHALLERRRAGWAAPPPRRRRLRDLLEADPAGLG